MGGTSVYLNNIAPNLYMIQKQVSITRMILSKSNGVTISNWRYIIVRETALY